MATQLSAAPSVSFYGVSSGSQATKNSKEIEGIAKNISSGWAGNLLLMAELRKKLITFRDIIDLPSCDGSGPINQLVMGTIKELCSLYPKVLLNNLKIDEEETSLNQGLCYLYDALKLIGDSWTQNHMWAVGPSDDHDADISTESLTLEQLGGRVLTRLNRDIEMARKIFEVMEEDGNNGDSRIEGLITGHMLTESFAKKKKISCPSPDTPMSLSPQVAFSMELGEFANASHSLPVLLPLRLKAMEKLQPFEMKFLPFNRCSPTFAHRCSPTKQTNQTFDETKEEMQDAFPKSPSPRSNAMSEEKASAAGTNPHASPNTFTAMATTVPLPPFNFPSQGTPTPPPPVTPSNGSVPPPPAPTPLAKGAAPPPPPPVGGATRALRPKKSTKLKRSSHMGNLYRILKGKVEGSSLNVKTSQARKSQIGGSNGGKQGMADALAEITRRSTYFQQIEEDVRKHTKLIMEIKGSINSFQTKDMTELLKFHKYVEQHLEKLTDETQVLVKFEGFPAKKLESVRTAAALYSKLEEIAANLENWKVVSPLGHQLDKVESYFNKIKGEIDALERSKDEESKRFQSHNIHFDFNILVRIKESMVDVSSNCIELALKERREAKAAETTESGRNSRASTKTLWRAFQIAFRVYSFAGGQDDRADVLTKALALEIETDPQPQ